MTSNLKPNKSNGHSLALSFNPIVVYGCITKDNQGDGEDEKYRSRVSLIKISDWPNSAMLKV